MSGEEDDQGLAGFEAAFVDNWAALACAFGMDARLGRAHALSYLACDPVTADQIAEQLDLDAAAAQLLLCELSDLGVVRELPQGGFLAHADPWTWFLSTLKARGRREFAPLMDGIRQVHDGVRRLAVSDPGEVARVERIARFTQFVDQVAGLLETFASLGAGPVLRAMRMVAKMRGR